LKEGRYAGAFRVRISLNKRSILLNINMKSTFIDEAGTKRLSIDRSCEECGKLYNPTYIRQRFCCKSCSNAKCKRRAKKVSYCYREECNNELDHYTNKFCKSCRESGYSKARTVNGKPIIDCTLLEASLARIGGANAYDSIRAHARSILRYRINAGAGCEECGWSRHVQVCHIKSIKSFSENALVSEINHLNNLKLLCPNCHWLFDHKNNTPGRT